jgi:ArsR family transcriptional regulator, arsenate/arsenite/antimonite-responsive transcriptional repressor
MYIDVFCHMANTIAPDLARAAQVFHALSDVTRLAILEMLESGERCVCDLQDTLDAAQSRLSFHLRVLKDVGFVSDRRDGRWSYYELNRDTFDEAEALIQELKPRARRATRKTDVGARDCCG